MCLAAHFLYMSGNINVVNYNIAIIADIRKPDRSILKYTINMIKTLYTPLMKRVPVPYR